MKDQHCIATAEVARSLGEPAAPMCICRHPESAHDEGDLLGRGRCTHAVNWWESTGVSTTCRCKRFEEQR
jgi:hypothetical protein